MTELIQYFDNGDKKLDEYTMLYDRSGFITNGGLYNNYDAGKTVIKGWTSNHAYFKGEGDQINIGLGRGAALDIFNKNIIDCNMVGKR
ncbi:hypothetical protein QNH39_18040 [Neobacillus novalis]|uniref:Uncharacterized protein n=1 Tax=Neobacillus novalis TaxID=220687 RepID=A0AA95MLT0_9BACI|nr:hypothetical protein [Neobacillus novalis]WHY84549.1 hypothetical protein QNH39_18040 [Neobacillus novalis]